jgi:hypothetical protein
MYQTRARRDGTFAFEQLYKKVANLRPERWLREARWGIDLADNGKDI